MTDVTTEPEPLRFNWRECKEHDETAFLRWLIPTLLVQSGSRLNDWDVHHEVARATSDFTDIKLNVVINGVTLSGRHFIETLKMNYERATEEAARGLLSDLLDTSAVDEELTNLRRAVRNHADQVARRLGFELNHDDD